MEQVLPLSFKGFRKAGRKYAGSLRSPSYCEQRELVYSFRFCNSFGALSYETVSGRPLAVEELKQLQHDNVENNG